MRNHYRHRLPVSICSHADSAIPVSAYHVTILSVDDLLSNCLHILVASLIAQANIFGKPGQTWAD